MVGKKISRLFNERAEKRGFVIKESNLISVVWRKP